MASTDCGLNVVLNVVPLQFRDRYIVLLSLIALCSCPTTVLDPSFKPSFTLTLFYKQHNDSVDLGNTIPPANTTQRPDIYMHDLSLINDQAGVSDRSSSLQIKISPLSPTRTFKPNTTFALVLTDPDATSHAKPAKAQMCHWVVTAISNQTISNNDDDEQYSALESTIFAPSNNRGPKTPPNVHELVEYLPPSPPPKTGLHRYFFVLLAQKHGHEDEAVKKPKDRPHWGMCFSILPNLLFPPSSRTLLLLA